MCATNVKFALLSRLDSSLESPHLDCLSQASESSVMGSVELSKPSTGSETSKSLNALIVPRFFLICDPFFVM